MSLNGSMRGSFGLSIIIAMAACGPMSSDSESETHQDGSIVGDRQATAGSDGTNAVNGANVGEGAARANEAASTGGRVRVVEGMADPDVLRINDNSFLLSGTLSTVDLPLFTSTDLRTWTRAGTYSPSQVDPAHNYCFIWAPDLALRGDKIVLYFSAHQVNKGAACPPPAGRDVTTYRAEAPVGTLDFGVPQPLFAGGNGARTYSAAGCPAQGCDRAIRIDGAYDVETNRLFYVWFQNGNNISSINLDQPGNVLRHSTPSRPNEEGINEAPDIFRRNGLTYMFFSTGHFQGQYAMQYVAGPDINGLNRQRSLRRLSTPVRRRNGSMAETHGHNSVVTRGSEVWNFYHLGVFDGSGRLVRRDTYQQPLAFRRDGSAISQNSLRVRWSTLPGASYSLDVVLRDGSVIGPCIDAGIIGRNSAVTFDGICPGAGDRLVHKGQIATLRLFWSTDGTTWANHVDVPYDGIDDVASIALPNGTPSRVGLSWNELETGTQYSLDVKNRAGVWTAPCVGAHILDNSLEWEFDGACRTPNTRVEVADVATYRICSARNGDWASARCEDIQARP